MSASISEQRKAIFTPCKTKEHLKLWVKHFLNIELPDCTVLEESNSNPFDALWEPYDCILRNDVEGFTRVMSYASRGGFKTLSAAILETLLLLHTDRSVGHMAAIERQSKISAGYVKGFFQLPHLRDYVDNDNATDFVIVKYVHKVTGDIITSKEFTKVAVDKRPAWIRKQNKLTIVLCTMAGANGLHVNGLFVVDEVDVVPKQHVPAYFQSKSIPDTSSGFRPITLLTSTRKFRTGLVQKELDEAVNTGLVARHWNLIDLTSACEQERHLPDRPKQTYWINDNTLKHITEAEYQTLNPAVQAKYVSAEGYEGCAKCPLFAACKGRLATHQTSKSLMLKPVADTIDKFKGAPGPEYIQTEFLCRKPDSTGLIYPRLDPEVHYKEAADIIEMVTGTRDPMADKQKVIQELRRRGAKFFTGMDFGFSHNFVSATFASYGAFVYVLDVFAQSNLDLDQKIEACQYIKTTYGNPVVFGDPAYPSDIISFRKNGYKMREWEKGPGSVKAGIEMVRTLIWDSRGRTRLFFLKDDEGVKLLFDRMSRYAFVTDAAGQVTEEPNDKDDDECDAMRYGIMNGMGKNGVLVDNATYQNDTIPNAPLAPSNIHALQLTNMIKSLTGQIDAPSRDSTAQPTQTIKKGRFLFNG